MEREKSIAPYARNDDDILSTAKADVALRHNTQHTLIF